MEYWLLPSNGKKFRLDDFLIEYGFVDWRQYNNFNIGDVVYMYSSKPICRITYLMKVTKVGMTFEEAVTDRSFWIDSKEYEVGHNHNKYCRFEVITPIGSNKLKLNYLMQNGLKQAPQGGMKLTGNLLIYIQEEYQKCQNNIENIQALNVDSLWEGARKKIVVNKYERNIIAREKCIEMHGCQCTICGMDFEKIYGEIGKGFIHIHHIIPISEIGKNYRINYATDLVPVCPNCHAMLHHGKNGRVLTIDELKQIVLNHHL